MNGARKLTFAPFVAAACVLWILATATGSQGFTAIIVLLGIAALFFNRPSFRMPLYGWLLVVGLAWITLSTFWSAAGGGFVSGSLTGEDFAVDVASLRVGGVALFSAFAIGAALSVQPGEAETSNKAILFVVGLQVFLITVTFLLREPILAFAYPGNPEGALQDGVQNFQRAGNAVAVILPIGLAAGWHKFQGMPARAAIVAITAIALIVFQLLGSQSAVLSVLLMLVAFAALRLWPHGGLKWMMRGIAGYVLLAPLLLLAGTYLVGALGVRLPESFQARVFGWRETISKIMERPLTGHGLEASGTWQHTYATRPEWLEQITGLAANGQAEAMNKAWQHYPIVPGHPHNMPLELWAETGAAGAVLIAAALWFASARMPSLTTTNRAAGYAAAGLIGAALPLFSFAYSAWNEAYWGMLAVAICAVILLTKRAAT